MLNNCQLSIVNLKITVHCQLSTVNFTFPYKKAPPRFTAAVQEDVATYRYFFIPSEAVSGSAEMVMVISMLFSLAKFATQSTKASLAAWS